MKRRVVITGMGCISALGQSLKVFEESIFHGHSGVQALNNPAFEKNSVRIGAPVSCDLSSIDYNQKTLSRLDPFMVYGIRAGIEAVEASNLESYAALDRTRVGVLIGSGIGGLRTIEQQAQVLMSKGPKGISPFFITNTLINMASGHLAIKYEYHGPNLSTATACTTGSHTILQAADMIINDYADVMLAGGAESSISSLGLAGFSAARALSTRNEEPEKASRPFDKDRNGFVMADGAAVLVLEEYEHAIKRGAVILCELLGGGYSGDGYHMTQPHPQGLGARLAMEMALKRSQCSASDIDVINPHATSTPLGDTLELEAILSTFGDHGKNIWVTPTKGMTGHLLGAAGALEAIICILCLQRQQIPPAINLENPQAPADSMRIPINTAPYVKINHIMNNSFGFGGSNASIIFKKI